MKAISGGEGWKGGAATASALTLTLLLGLGCKADGKSSLNARSGARDTGVAALAASRTAYYTLELESDVDYGEGSALSLSLRSRLELQRLTDTVAGVARFDLTLPDARFEQASATAPEFVELAAELARGVVIELRAGTLTEVRSEAPVSAFAANLLRSVAAAFELPQPTEPAATRWTAETTDPAGRCTTELTALGAGKYVKKKLSYRPTAVVPAAGKLAFDLALAPRVASSNGSIETGPEGISSSSYDDRLEMELTGSTKARAHNRVSIRLQSTKSTTPRRRGPTTPLGAPTPSATAVDRAHLDAVKIGKLTFDTAVRALAASVNDEAPLLVTDSEQKRATPEANAARERRLDEHNRVFSAMTAILRTQPGAVTRAMALIRAGKPPAKLLVDALAAADTAAANDALVRLAGDAHLGTDLRSAVAHDLSRVDTPTPETVTALMTLLDTPEYGLIALYGLGTQARHFRDSGDRTRADRIGQVLALRLQQAEDSDGRVHALRAIANSGLPSLLPAVRPLLTEKSEIVRSAALEALRLMDTPEVDQLIASRLQGEESAFVRRAAINAAKTRNPTPPLKTAILAAATHEQDDHGRYAAITLLVRWLPQDATLREPLKRVADNDSVPALRSAARAAL